MIEKIKVKRETMIRDLTNSMFDAMEKDAQYRYEVCQFGHVGFEYLDDNALLTEYRSLILDDDDATIIEMEK